MRFAREGYITSVSMDESLDIAAIAVLCKIPDAEYTAEIQTAVADIINYSIERNQGSEIVLTYDREDYPEDEVDYADFSLTVKLGDNGKGLVFEVTDLADTEMTASIVMPLRSINRGMRAYREHQKYMESFGYTPHKITFFDKVRGETHADMMHAIGIPLTSNSASNIWVQEQIGKYLSSLVLAIFPKAPADDWRLSPLSPAQGGKNASQRFDL